MSSGDSTPNSTGYDPFSRPNARVDAAGVRSTTVYDAYGRAVAQVNGLGYRGSFAYDSLGRLEVAIDPFGNRTTTVYDALDRGVAQINALGERTSTVYDAAGRVAATVEPLGYRTSSVYDAAGRPTAGVDALGHRTTRVYDAAGRGLAAVDARGYATSSVHDAAGRLLATVDAAGSRWTNVYDARGGLLAEEDPLGARTTYVYDADGRLTQRVDARGWPTSYSLDALGRTTGQVYLDGGRVTYLFDAAGRLAAMGDVTGWTSHTYDAAGRQTKVVYPIGKHLSYSYDALGNRTILVDQDGGTTTYTYDARNQLAAVVNPLAERTTWLWDALGREQRQTLANGACVSMLHDAGGRATSRVYRDGAGVPLAMFTATYDAVGNRVGVDELGGSFAYAYDASRQLIAEHRTGTSAYSCTFSYDGVGNRLASTAQDGAVTSYAYNPAHELLSTQALGAAPTTFGNDAAGNTVREVGPSVDVTYTWDGENRLTQVNSAGSMETYTYDASGRRRKKTAGGATTNFVWDRVNLLAELDGDLARTAQYTDLPGVWGGLASQRRNGTSRHFAFDLSANTRALLDGGTVTDSYLYRAFGVEEATSGSTVNVLRFGGQVGYYRDLADRLYVRARHYRPGVGRWMSRDPAGRLLTPGGQLASLYEYAGNACITSIDPDGLNPVLLLCGYACGGSAALIWYLLERCSQEAGFCDKLNCMARIIRRWPPGLSLPTMGVLIACTTCIVSAFRGIAKLSQAELAGLVCVIGALFGGLVI